MKIYPNSIIEDMKENYIVGVLATDKTNLPFLGDEQEPVTVLKDQYEVIFYIKPLSPEPKEMMKIQKEALNMSKYYIGFADRTEIENIHTLDMKHLSLDEKVNHLKNKMEGKLVLFNPLLNQEQKRERYHKNIDRLLIEDDYWEEGVWYTPVPSFNISNESLEELLLSGEPIELPQYTKAMPFPYYLLCGNYIYGDIRDNNWRIDSTNNKSFILIEPGSIKRVEITDDEREEFIGPERENLAFIDDSFLSKVIDERIQERGETLNELQQIKESVNTMSKSNTDSKVNNIERAPVAATKESESDIPEVEFIDYLEATAKSRKLVYGRKDIVNFHVSIKSSAFTILSGQSGIGKTQLATLYGEALGLSQREGDMLIMPISPAYTEPSDILGFLNPNTGLYMPSDTGLVDFLLKAEGNRDKVHMLILDEMNLSQIEHYFSPFISLLELDENDRYLSLYNSGNICHNNQKYKSSIKLYDNLIIVGTMNTDETTKDLSDRLLDRSSVVVLEKKSFIDISNVLSENKKESTNQFKGQDIAHGEIYLKWRSTEDKWDSFEEEELMFFDKIDKAISSVDPKKGFSIRNLIRMGDYLNNIPTDIDGIPEIDRRLAIDLFIKQRVITKIKGPIEIYESLIGTELEDLDKQGDLIKLFMSALNISDFKYTLRELRKKARELYTHGYIS